MSNEPQLSLIYTTHKNEKEAEILAEQLLRKGLIACANIFPSGQSVYMWNGGLNKETETVAILKTTPEKLHHTREAYLKLHPYEVPCFVVLSGNQVSLDYLRWAQDQLAET